MFGAAEADLHAHFIDRRRKQRAQIGGRRLAEIDRKPRQQRIEQRRLPRLERMAFAPAEEGAGCLVGTVVPLVHGVIVRESGRSSIRRLHK
jgi:hypothetical protein